MRRAVIVNADDFGMSPAVNAGIARAHRDGVVTSASLFAVGPAFAEAAAMAQTMPRLGIGVHLAWVDGRPLSDPRDVPTLVNRTGRFLSGWPAFILRYVQGGVDLDEVEREAAAQIERVRAAGVVPDHLNSHEHLHVLPGVFERVTALAKRYGIPAIRIPKEPVVDWRGDVARLPGLVRRLALHGAVALLNGRAHGFPRAAACFGLADSCRLTEQRLVRFLRAVPEGISELMCHAASGSGDAGRRDRELAALVSPAAREAVATAGLALTTFGAAYAVSGQGAVRR